jgi:hypothetical protein
LTAAFLAATLVALLAGSKIGARRSSSPAAQNVAPSHQGSLERDWRSPMTRSGFVLGFVVTQVGGPIGYLVQDRNEP